MADGDLLGSRYEVLRTVSDGRRAKVLQAIDRVHDRLVALKVFPVSDLDRDELLTEARALMSIAPHPALPVVRGDFFTDDGHHYVLVMNWIDGTDLQQVLEEEGDPGLLLEEVIADLGQVADALDHLHAHEPPIVHGDVKPANLVRTAAGRVVLVDFDIAGARAGQDRWGTVGFVAPEVMAGDKPGPASDVFGLAATAVTLLNGRPPSEAPPSYPGIDPAEQGQLARILRGALATDPARRPRSAGKLVHSLRGAGRADQPSGIVALLATEVADTGRLWDEDPNEMRVAMTRLRDVRDEAVQRGGGRIVTSMNEGDRTIAVFREASSAALAALDLHDGLARLVLPPGIDVRLRAAIAVGEATLVDGVYTGAVVDLVLRLRSSAGPGMTITTEATAELLVGLVGPEMSIVPLGKIVTPSLRHGKSIFALTRAGAEGIATMPLHPVVQAADPAVIEAEVSRRALIVAALQHAGTLMSVTLVGLAVIFRLVLSPEIGLEWVGMLTIALGSLASIASFGWCYSSGYLEAQARIAEGRRDREIEARARDVARERAESRRRLEVGFARLATTDGREGGRVLAALGGGFDGIAELLRRADGRLSVSMSSLLPNLSDETYRHGMSALSDAVELFESADGGQRRRLEDDLIEIEERLVCDISADERGRLRDEQRLASHRQLLTRLEESRQRARDLVFEAERCTAALAEAHIELASVRAGDTQVDVDAVVRTLQQTIRRVRDVQDEFRRLGH